MVPASEGLTAHHPLRRLEVSAGDNETHVMTAFRRTLIGPIAIGALLAGAGVSDGAVLIGSNLSAAPTNSICTAGVACTYIQTLGGVPLATAPFDGVITSWRVQSGSAGGDATLRVVHSHGGGRYMAGSAGIATQTLVVGLNTFPARIPIAAGDAIGLDNGTNALLFGVAGEAVYVFNPTLSQLGSGTPAVSVQSVGRELLLNASVEADDDGDGYGDETQDGCPADRSRLAPPCAPRFEVTGMSVSPALLRAPLTASSRFTVRFTSTRPGNVLVTVESLRSGRRFGGECVPPDLSPGGARCTLVHPVRIVPRNLTAGATSFAIKPKGLPIGLYRVSVNVTDRLGPGVVRRTFIVRIVRR